MTVKKKGGDKKAKNQNVKRKGKRNISINVENRRRRIVTAIQKQIVQGKIDKFLSCRSITSFKMSNF